MMEDALVKVRGGAHKVALFHLLWQASSLELPPLCFILFSLSSSYNVLIFSVPFTFITLSVQLPLRYNYLSRSKTKKTKKNNNKVSVLRSASVRAQTRVHIHL